MKSFTLFFFVLIAFSSADNLQAIKNTLKSLCSVNSNGKFGQCCKNNAPDTITLESYPSCYGDIDFDSKPPQFTLEGCELTQLAPKVFSSLDMMGLIFLTDNSLTAIPSDAFNGLTNLQQLFLDKNKLTSIDSDAFQGLNAISYLDLEENQLTIIPSEVFDNIKTVQTLVFDKNKLTRLPSRTFSGLKNLHDLHLSENHLTFISPNVFTEKNSLEILDLSFNSITFIPLNVFPYMPKLKELDLKHNCVDCNQFKGINITQLKCNEDQDDCPSDLSSCTTELIHEGCATCKDEEGNKVCTSCNTGFFFNMNTKTCQQCYYDACCNGSSVVVVTCDVCNDEQDKCDKCARTQKLYNHTCIPGAASTLTSGIFQIAFVLAVLLSVILF